MLNEQRKIDALTKEEKNIIVAEDIGVSFDVKSNNDDYKSRIINLFKPKKESPSKQPKKILPLTSISCTGRQGEILGIIGSNGAGKTTLSKIITGILKHDKGYLHVDGKVTALFSFGMGFNKELTGRENVYLNGMM